MIPETQLNSGLELMKSYTVWNTKQRNFSRSFNLANCSHHKNQNNIRTVDAISLNRKGEINIVVSAESPTHLFHCLSELLQCIFNIKLEHVPKCTFIFCYCVVELHPELKTPLSLHAKISQHQLKIKWKSAFYIHSYYSCLLYTSRCV